MSKDSLEKIEKREEMDRMTLYLPARIKRRVFALKGKGYKLPKRLSELVTEFVDALDEETV